MRFFLLVLLLFSAQSFATTYYWVGSGGGPSYPDPSGACNYIGTSTYGSNNPSQSFVSTRIVNNSVTSASCYFTVLTIGTGVTAELKNPSYVSRYGNSCPTGTTLNAVTGTCDTPVFYPPGSLCDSQVGASIGMPIIHDLTGACVPFLQADTTSTCASLAITHPTQSLKVRGSVDASGNGVLASNLASSFGGMCEGTMSNADCVVGPTKCTKGLCTSPSTSTCTGTFTFTGRPAVPVPPDLGLAGKNSICDAGANCNLPPAASTDETKPCTKVYDAEGRQSCSSSNFTGTDGAVNCGTVNGQFGCRGAYPSSKGIEIASTTAVQALIDGSTKEVTTNNATQSVCSGGMGPGVCVISTSTSTVTTSHSSTGVVSGTATVCSGSLCGNAAVNTGTGSGTGTASGSVGDCVKDCGTPAGSSPKASSLAAPAQGNFDGEADKWQKKIDDSKTEVVAALDKMKALFKPISNISLGGGGQLYCPPPVQILDHSISFCLDDYAGSLSWISEVVLLVCTVSAMFIIFL
jgi:hypothetical protein